MESFKNSNYISKQTLLCFTQAKQTNRENANFIILLSIESLIRFICENQSYRIVDGFCYLAMGLTFKIFHYTSHVCLFLVPIDERTFICSCWQGIPRNCFWWKRNDCKYNLKLFMILYLIQNFSTLDKWTTRDVDTITDTASLSRN